MFPILQHPSSKMAILLVTACLRNLFVDSRSTFSHHKALVVLLSFYARPGRYSSEQARAPFEVLSRRREML